MRHGETAWSKSGRFTGRSDISLTQRGEAEARQLGERLQSLTFSHIFCSPLLRARQTCKLAGLSSNMRIDDDLTEWDYGCFVSRTYADIVDVHPRWNLFRDGCPNGESPTEITARVDSFLDRCSLLDGNIALFTHGHVGRILAARWISLETQHAESFSLDTASVSILSDVQNDCVKRSLKLWNSTTWIISVSHPWQFSRTAEAAKQRALERWENEGGEVVEPSLQVAIDA
jgi:broad specificity phosphatase PhoE